MTKETKTANAVLGQISRAFPFRDKRFLQDYTNSANVQPHLENVVQAWSRWLEKDKEVLEKRAALSASADVKSQEYEGRLKELGWVSLTERRQRADMAMMNGITSERMDIDTADWFVSEASSERNPRQNTGRLNVRQIFGRLEIRKNFYTVRTTKDWNEIPIEIKS